MRSVFPVLLYLVSVTASVVWGSALEIYRDGAKYRMIPIDRFVGMTKGVQALCESQEMRLLPLESCPPKQRLCQVVKQLGEQEHATMALQQEQEVLKQLLMTVKPTKIDAGAWIDAAAKLGTHQATLIQKQTEMRQRLRSMRADFKRQAPSREPVGTRRKCDGELLLTMPAGYLSARLRYEADIRDPKYIAIEQSMMLRNRSGIDIVAKEADVYARAYRVALRPLHFTPWRVSLQEKKPASASDRHSRSLQMESAMLRKSTAESVVPTAPAAAVDTAVQTGYKNYHLTGVELPSTGEEIELKIEAYRSEASCELIAYPYQDRHLYRLCSFMPQSPVVSHRWRITDGERLVSSEAYGLYREGKYLLNTGVDETVLIERSRMVERDRSSGIFGGAIRKKDGYTLQLTNLSQQRKEIRLVERIPTSTTDKIESKLLKVTGAESYRLLADGRLELHLVLAPREERSIAVSFTLSYDKKQKIDY